MFWDMSLVPRMPRWVWIQVALYIYYLLRGKGDDKQLFYRPPTASVNTYLTQPCSCANKRERDFFFLFPFSLILVSFN